VTVRQVATLRERGESIQEIGEDLGLTEAQVYHALSYFFDHRDEITALIAQEEQAHARFTSLETLFVRLYLDRHIMARLAVDLRAQGLTLTFPAL
jgi:hypothetical protein